MEMNSLISKIKELSADSSNVEKIEKILEDQLINEPENVTLWLRLAILELAFPLVDYNKSFECLEKILALEKNNPVAFLILAYIKNYELGGLDEPFFDRLNCLSTSNDEINSMLKYVASWFYSTEQNIILQEKLHKESIEVYSGHVYNYLNLAKIYFKKNRDEDAKILIQKAIENIVKVYSDEELKKGYDLTDVNIFLNQQITGIYQTKIGLESIKNYQWL